MQRRRTMGAVLLTGAAVLSIGMSQSSAQQGNGNHGESEVQRGFDIAPVPLDLKSKQKNLVGLGSYYVNSISECTGCHTAEGGPYLGGGRVFGPVQSRNLTPDFSGLPAGLTLAQFKAAMRSGNDAKNLFPPGPLIVMPWPAYQHGTEKWTESIYEYLRAIPCAEGGPGNEPGRC